MAFWGIRTCSHSPTVFSSRQIRTDSSRDARQGATLAAQLVIRYIVENPFSTIQELPLKFAIFINGATPPCVLPLDGEQLFDCPIEEFEEAAHLFSVFKPNNTDNATQLRPAKLANGRKVSLQKFLILGIENLRPATDIKFTGGDRRNELHDTL